MPHTIDLLQKALEMRKASQWCERFNITKGTIFQAKKRGSLGPTLAGAFAMEIGADPIFWTAVAAAEAEPPGPLRDRLERSLESQKTAHYGHPNDNDFQLLSPLIQWAFCCQTATLQPGTSVGGSLVTIAVIALQWCGIARVAVPGQGCRFAVVQCSRRCSRWPL